MRLISRLLVFLVPFLFLGCTTTELARPLRPVARELPLAQINHQSTVGDRLEIAIWRDGTVLYQYDKKRYVVAHAMPETLQQLKDRIAELDFSTTPLPTASAPPTTTLFVAGRRQATRPVALYSNHHALASGHELDQQAPATDDFRLLWDAVREHVENAAEHTMNPEFVADFNTRRLWRSGPGNASISVLEVFGDKIDNSPEFISIDHEEMFPDSF